MSCVSALVTNVIGVTLVTEELFNALASRAGVFRVGTDLSIKVVNTVVTLFDLVVGFGLALGTGVRRDSNRGLCCWNIQCCRDSSRASCLVRQRSVLIAHKRSEVIVTSRVNADRSILKTTDKRGNNGLVLCSH